MRALFLSAATCLSTMATVNGKITMAQTRTDEHALALTFVSAALPGVNV